MQLLWICLGGAAGSGARYLLAEWARKSLGASFPYGTFLANLLGSFLLGFLMYLGGKTSVFSPNIRLALTAGLMGGFTTYSTFNYETLRYLQEGAFWTGSLYLGLTVAGCLAAGALGVLLARFLVGA